MLSTQQKSVAQAIVNVFETGAAMGDYGRTVILPDGAGISYGRSQATDGGDNLDAIVFRYLDRQGPLAAKLEPYLDELQADATTRLDPKKPPPWAADLMQLLREAGQDVVMRRVQDEIFDENYWAPAVQQAAAAGLKLPLSYAVVYDTCIHSGPGAVPRMRKLFPELPPARGGDEHAWTKAYVSARRVWLSTFVSPHGSATTQLVRKTVYRMDAFRQLIDAGKWDLAVPLLVRGATIDASIYAAPVA